MLGVEVNERWLKVWNKNSMWSHVWFSVLPLFDPCRIILFDLILREHNVSSRCRLASPVPSPSLSHVIDDDAPLDASMDRWTRYKSSEHRGLEMRYHSTETESREWQPVSEHRDDSSSHTLTESMPAAAGEHDDAPPRSSPARFARGQLVDALSVRQHTRPRAVHATPCSYLLSPASHPRDLLHHLRSGRRYFRWRKSERWMDDLHQSQRLIDVCVQWKPLWVWLSYIKLSTNFWISSSLYRGALVTTQGKRETWLSLE